VPGEPGFTYASHIKAVKKAIEEDRAKRLAEAEAYRVSASDDFEAMFAGTMRSICARDPDIAEAYRGMITPPNRRTKRASGLTLVVDNTVGG
jgi:hypothetical protein